MVTHTQPVQQPFVRMTDEREKIQVTMEYHSEYIKHKTPAGLIIYQGIRIERSLNYSWEAPYLHLTSSPSISFSTTSDGSPRSSPRLCGHGCFTKLMIWIHMQFKNFSVQLEIQP
ncbi:hypothetical protein M9H77_14237 [Catharanthus roseus]|uniref:Uncharacterized protein n=1 Tax=Catharanthus roseus TaxID=4058 RepID=A0ACC0BMQ2_CATRO|nr:hypothetical protein M9H77_14237 [Catharanthus roseus]